MRAVKPYIISRKYKTRKKRQLKPFDDEKNKICKVSDRTRNQKKIIDRRLENEDNFVRRPAYFFFKILVEFKIFKMILVKFKILVKRQASEISIKASDSQREQVEIELTPDGFEAFAKKKRIQAETLIKNMDFSKKLISKLIPEIEEELSNFGKGITVVLCGSFGRLEGSKASDADLFAIFENGNENLENAIKVMIKIEKRFTQEGISVYSGNLEEKLKKDAKEGFNKGRFPTIFPKDKLLKSLGSDYDSDEWRTRRMCILTESIPIYNRPLFDQIKNELLKKYLVDIATSINRLPETFLGDFKEWCLSAGDPWRREQSTLSMIKAEHQRKFIHNATFLAFASPLIPGTNDRFNIQAILELPPLLRLLGAIKFMPQNLYNANHGKIKELIETYNHSSTILSDENLRRYLKKDTQSKEAKYLIKELTKNEIKIKKKFKKIWESLDSKVITELSFP